MVLVVVLSGNLRSVWAYHGGGVVDVGAGRFVDDPEIWKSEADFRSSNLRLCVWGGTPRACRRRSLVGDKDCGAATVFLWLNRDVAGATKLPARLAFKFPGGRSPPPPRHHHGIDQPCASLREPLPRPRRDRNRQSPALCLPNPIFASLKTLLCSILSPRCRRQTSRARW